MRIYNIPAPHVPHEQKRRFILVPFGGYIPPFPILVMELIEFPCRSKLRDNNQGISRVTTKCKVYQACVLSVLLYGSECWTPLKKLDSFHNRCIRTIMGISNKQQWEQHITSVEIRRKWGDPETATLKVKKRRLEWLGHVARMPDHRIPKVCLFSWLPQRRPRGGLRLRW